MKKEDKKVVIETLTEQVNSYKHLYVSDISGLDAVDTQALRRACFDANIKLVQVKNTLLKKAGIQGRIRRRMCLCWRGSA